MLFPKFTDATCLAYTEALQELEVSCDRTSSLDDATDSFRTTQYSLVIIDARNTSQFDALLMSKSVEIANILTTLY